MSGELKNLDHANFKEAHKFASNINPARLDEKKEFDIIMEEQPHFEPEFNALKKRINFIRAIAESSDFDHDRLPTIIKNMKNLSYLERWILSGYSVVEQNINYYKFLNVKQTDDDIKNMFAHVVFGLIKDNILNEPLSNQEIIYIKTKLFSRIGITSNIKYRIMRRLIIKKFIIESNIKLFIDNDEKIREMIKLFVSDGELKVPTFTTNIHNVVDEYKSFVNGTDTNNVKLASFKYSNISRNFFPDGDEQFEKIAQHLSAKKN